MGPQKRLVVVSSDDEEDAIPPTKRKQRTSKSSSEVAKNGIEKQSLPTRSRAKSTAHAENESPPRRFTRNSKTIAEKRSSKPISTFFSNSNKPALSKRRSPELASLEIEDDVEDLIEDDSPAERLEDLPRPHNTAKAILDRRKGQREDVLPNGSQKFKLSGKVTSSKSIKPTTYEDVDSRPWADRFGPVNLDELVVHKKKVSDVRDWLQNAFQGRNRMRLLILKGPSGAGKTATISILAKAMGFTLSEWRNPTGSEYMSEGYVSMSAQFEDFIGRSGRFGRLDFSSTMKGTEEIPKSDGEEQNNRRKVILLEEFPSVFMSSSSALRSFRSNILEYLAVNALAENHRDNITPLIMIITETRLTTTTALHDSFTAHRLLGSEILSHPGVSVIDFNPVAPTLLTKALDLVIQKEARQSGRRRMPGPLVLKRLGEVGDVRSAIGSLEFLCVRGDDDQSWSGRVASKASKASNKSSTITKMEKQSLEIVTQRESSLGLFHAVGKVVYNKRDDAPTTPAQPPHHMPEHVRSRVSQVSVENLIDETGTDPETFIAALHENYVLSCEGTSFIDTINDCLYALSDSDIMGPARGGRLNSTAMNGEGSLQKMASDSLRQDQICFQLAVRGLLFALPDPVKRRAHPVVGKDGGKTDAYKMFYPTSIRLLRQVEEISDSVNQWIDHLRAGVAPLGGSINLRRRQLAGIRIGTKDPSSKGATMPPHEVQQDEGEPMRTSLNCTKAELVLERLPYVTKIEQRNQSSSQLHQLEKITQFHGVQVPNDETSDDEDTDGSALHQGAGQIGIEVATLIPPAKQEVEKMYMSDDDIED